MAIKIDRELAGNINNPSIALLKYCIKRHQKEIARLDKLNDYYNGEHAIVKRDKSADSKLTNIVVNNAKYVTDMNVGFMLGNPIAYTAGKDKDISSLITSLDQMKIKKHDRELGKDLSVFGVAIELYYLAIKPGTENETIAKIAKVDPRGMFIVTDDSVDSNYLFAVRYLEKFDLNDKSDGWIVEVYTINHKIIHKTNDLAFTKSSVKGVKEHFFGDVPATEFRNNEEKQGDFEQALTLIDAYNILQSDRINDKEAFIDAILILYGFTIEEAEESKKKNGGKIIEAPAKEDGGDVGWLTKTFDESQVQLLAKALENDLHKVTYTPNLNDENFAGNISGEAMKYKLFGLLQLLVTKTGYFEDGLERRLRLLQHLLSVKGQKVDVEGVKINFKPNLPINVKDVIEQIRDSQEFVPLLISLGWLPDIDDPKEVLELLRKQKEEDIALAQKAIGKSSSHNDIDDEPEEDEDDNSDI